jgi:hypothetical protein
VAKAREVLESAWRADGDAGFCVPNPSTYPWQWLWDSCFHAVVWAHLGDERALTELAAALDPIDDDGFVPHVRYAGGSNPHESFWGRAATSSITQPPMYGHALAEASRLGLEPPPVLIERATRGVRFLLERRRRSPGGLVELCHPWESGCDDSPRWDDLCPGGWSVRRWFDRKGALLRSVHRTRGGAPLWNDEVAVGSVGFNALLAFNVRELASLTGDDVLAGAAAELVDALDERWDPELSTWVDDGPTATGSGRIRTHDALLPVLVTRLDPSRPLRALVDPAAHGGRAGPTSVHRDEPTFRPNRYWRGSVWPQLGYLSWVAATRCASSEVARSLSTMVTAGAWSSGWAEHWDADTGAGLGAAPQSWTGLVVAFGAGRDA